jgi:hypothetical protein
MALTRPTAAQITTTTVDFTDPLIRLNKDQSGANNKDIGIIFERGSDSNVAIIWDESTDQFALINTTEIGTTSGNVVISSYSNVKVDNLEATGITGTLATASQPNITSVGTLTSLTASGVVSGSELTSSLASGDEGGQINLAKPPNATIAGGITIDVFQNQLRFFVQGGAAKGAYIDMSSTADGVGTNLLGASVPGDGTLTLAVSGTGLSGSASFTANQSSGSTFTVTSNATSANTVSTIVARDASGDFSAGTITASGLTLNGNSTFSNGLFTFNTPAGSLGNAAGAVNTLQVRQETGNTDAFQSFHVNGDYAVHFGLDGTTNDLFVGGWSMGANKYKIWHAGNDGTGSGLDADTVDGYNPATTNTGNTIVLRDASGNFSAGVITATSTSARYADLAENFLADKLYPIGTVLMVGGSAEITIAVKDSSPVIGTVSENPAYLMNSSLTGDYVTPVAYIGRVPCRVVGYIRKGTRLILSNIPGVACAALSNNEIDYQAVGIALQDYDSNIEGLIEILVGR